jgi:hypothetical protein
MTSRCLAARKLSFAATWMNMIAPFLLRILLMDAVSRSILAVLQRIASGRLASGCFPCGMCKEEVAAPDERSHGD